MFAERNPFQEITNQARLLAFILRNGRPTVPIPEVSKELNSLIITCWDQDPSNRPDMLNVMKKLESIEKQIPLDEKNIKTPTEKGL